MSYNKILVCINRRFGYNSPSCAARGGDEVLAALKQEAKERGSNIVIESIVCFGRCAEGPNIRFAPGGPFRGSVLPVQAGQILDECIEDRQDQSTGL